MEGRDPPPAPDKATLLAAVTPSSQQGSDPLPGESESDYIARQRRLQEEVRAYVPYCDNRIKQL